MSKGDGNLSWWRKLLYSLKGYEKIEKANNPLVYFDFIRRNIKDINISFTKAKKEYPEDDMGLAKYEIELNFKGYSYYFRIEDKKKLSSYSVEDFHHKFIGYLSQGNGRMVPDEIKEKVMFKFLYPDATMRFLEKDKVAKHRKKLSEQQSELYARFENQKDFMSELNRAYKEFRKLFPLEVVPTLPEPSKRVSAVEEDLRAIVRNPDVDKELRGKAQKRLNDLKKRKEDEEVEKKREKANQSAQLVLDTLDRYYPEPESPKESL
ncbi:hypothetical protein [Rossellomorea marisflavi]|uniref:hypothetical protein n=1 Tax=Rossellomorea marisflavi TaxID=189381 RepID=UPI003F9F0286